MEKMRHLFLTNQSEPTIKMLIPSISMYPHQGKSHIGPCDVSLVQSTFALDHNDVFLSFFLSSGVNHNIVNYATHFKSCANDMKSLCYRHQLRIK